MNLQHAQVSRSNAPAAVPGLREWIRDHDDKMVFVVLYLGLSVGLSIFIGLFWLVVVVALHFLLECIRQAHHWRDRRAVLLHALWEVKLDIGLVILAFTLVLYIEVVLGLLGVQAASRVAVASRAGARIGVRAAAWERNIRTFLLTVDEMARIGHAAVLYRGRRLTGGAVAATANAGNAGNARNAGNAEHASAARTAAPPSAPAPTAAAAAATATTATPATPAPTAAARTANVPPLRPAWRQPWGWADRIGVTLVVAGVSLILIAPLITPHDVGSAITTLLEQLHPFPPS